MDKNPKNQHDKEEFMQEIGLVKPLKHDKVNLKKTQHKPISMPTPASLEHTQYLSALSTTDIANAADIIEYRQNGVNQKTFSHLKRGHYPIQATLDLHGMTISQSEGLYINFMQTCAQHNYRHILLIHGKGSHTPDTNPVIKNKVNQWLRINTNVLAFCSAQPKHGGSGAVYVLFKRKKLS